MKYRTLALPEADLATVISALRSHAGDLKLSAEVPEAAPLRVTLESAAVNCNRIAYELEQGARDLHLAADGRTAPAVFPAEVAHAH